MWGLEDGQGHAEEGVVLREVVLQRGGQLCRVRKDRGWGEGGCNPVN